MEENINVKDFGKNLKFAWSYARNQKKYLVGLIIINILGISIGILAPVLSAKIILELTNNNFVHIIVVALAILLVNSFSNLINYFTRMWSIQIYRNILTKLEIDLGQNVLKIENKCIDEKGSGVFIQRLTGDTTKIADVFNSSLSQVSSFVKYLGIGVAVFIVNKWVFLYLIFTVLITGYIESVRTSERKKDDKVAREAGEKVSGLVGELVRGVRDIKMLNSEKDFISNLSVKIDDANNKWMRVRKRSWNFHLFSWELQDLFQFLLIVLLVIFMQNNWLVPAMALVLYNYCNTASYCVYLVGDILESIKDFNLSCERVYSLFDSSEFGKEKFGKKHIDNIKGNFEFKDVYFGYNDKEILKGLNFKIKARETVAFVGKSGAGKTTIFNLLCKMYNIKKGTITIDGIDINELDKDSIRGNITIISQDPYIFNMSIRDNLKLVKSDITEEEMINACKIACLDDYINELPDKYDSLIGEGGINLSGGQKQRLAIARALIQNTQIILFDEATSALDNETQSQIQKAIDNMRDDYTILIIAHRLSTIKNADRILFLEDGKIVASGVHDKLLKTSKSYKKLYESELTKD